MRRRSWFGVALALVLAACMAVLPGCSAEVDQGWLEDAVNEVLSSESDASEEEAEANEPSESDAGESKTGESEEVAEVEEPADDADETSQDPAKAEDESPTIDENGTYTSKDEVAGYLHTYGHLPKNYITKEEAEDEGWKTEGLTLDEACPGMSIGGDRFGNREGKLPTAKGRTWKECDIDYAGERSRNAKRIVYSNDGLIYYTDDHYQTFTRLY